MIIAIIGLALVLSLFSVQDVGKVVEVETTIAKPELQLIQEIEPIQNSTTKIISTYTPTKDPSKSVNAGVGAGRNDDSGPGEFQPIDPTLLEPNYCDNCVPPKLDPIPVVPCEGEWCGVVNGHFELED